MENTEVKISKILKQLGITPNILGYKYSKEAITMVLEDDTALRAITKTLYPEIGKRFNATSSSVERAIRHAAQRMTIRGDLELIEEIFANSVSANTGYPTNSEFIACVVEYIKLTQES